MRRTPESAVQETLAAGRAALPEYASLAEGEEGEDLPRYLSLRLHKLATDLQSGRAIRVS